MSDALILLKRFEGVPQFDWLKDIDKQLYSTSQLGKDVRSVVSFQHNLYLKGMDKDYYKQIFDAIVNQFFLSPRKLLFYSFSAKYL